MPNRVGLPTGEEIGELPRWAIVAFAARCARRVAPLCEIERPDAPAEEAQVVERLIALAEGAAATATEFKPIDLLVYDAAVYADAASAAKAAQSAAAETAHAVNAAYAAADADESALAFARAAARDYSLLRDSVEKEKWTNETRVAPGFFGPIWPEGPPEGWPAFDPASEGLELAIEIEIPGGAVEEDVFRIVKEMSEKLDDLHRAYGGRGIKIADLTIEIKAKVRVEAS